jgi:hypothetical protein
MITEKQHYIQSNNKTNNEQDAFAIFNTKELSLFHEFYNREND